MRAWICLFLLFTLLSGKEAEHAIYISVVDIEIEGHETSVKVKVFKDDLFNAIKNYAGGNIEKLSFPNGYAESIQGYFNKNLSITNDENKCELSYETFEVVGDSYWLSFSATLSQPVNKSLTINAPYFMELFPTQQNIVKTRIDSRKEQFFRLSSAEKSCSIVL